MFQKQSKKILIIFLITAFLLSVFNFALPDVSKKKISKNIVDKIYLAKQNPNVKDNFKFGIQKAQAAEDPAELEYSVDVGPVNGSTSANYVYGSFFNPSGSGRTAVIKRIAVRANAVSTGTYANLSVRRTTVASGGTQIIAGNIPRKNNDSSNPVTEVRHTGPTVTFAGTADSRILSQTMPGAAGQFYSYRDITLGVGDEKLVIQPNEGIALYQEAAGTASQKIRIYIEWEEVVSAPSAQTEFLFAFPRVEVAATANYVYNSFFNPAASGKTAIVKRIWFGTETCNGAAVYTNNIVIKRTSAASGGTAITAANVPKKHTGSVNSAMDFRRTGVTVTQVGGADARLGFVTPCAVAGQPHGFQQINFQQNDENLILQQGQGIALITEAAGDINQLARMIVEWQEVASGSTPASQGEYILAFPRVENAAALNSTFYAFFNPTGSGKTAVIKRLVIRNNADAAATYSAFNFRRLTAASGGISIATADRPKKHTSTADSAMNVLWCGAACATAVTATYAGTAGSDSGLMKVNGPGTLGQVIGQREIVFGDNEKLVLQQGEGVGFYLDVLAGDADHYKKILIEWDEETTAPASQGEYLIDIGPVAGSTTSGYNYASFFNPAASGKTAVVKKVSLRIDSVSTALYIPMTLRRTTSASAGTQIIAANIPKKHSGTANSAMDIRRTGVTVGLAGTADSRLTGIQTAGVAGTAIAPSTSGYKEFAFENDERIILQPGEGVALYQEAAGDADFRVKVLFEWGEVASGSTPASQGEYLLSTGPVNGSLTANYAYVSLFNPSGSNKNYVVKRIEIRANRIGAATAPSYIPATIRKTTTSSGGTSVAQANVPKKHAGTTTTTAQISHTGPTVTFAGVADSRLLGVTVPGLVNQYGDYENLVVYGDELILKQGEGLALYQEAASGDANLRFRFAFEWSESAVAGGGVITVGTTGNQVTSMNIPSTNNPVGGAFTLARDTGTANVTQMIVSETGSVNANANLSNLDLYYETAVTCSYEGTETLFGPAATFDSSENANVSGTMTVGTSQVCLYAVLDVGSGATAGQKIDIEITNPSTEVQVSSGTVLPATAVAINLDTNLQLANQAPNSPSSLAQKKTDDTVITTGQWVSTTSIKFTGTVSDPDSDQVQLCVEKDPVGTAFANSEDSCGSLVASGQTATITISGQTDATQYHWQARAKDEHGTYSVSWVSYGGNTDPNDPDYGLDTTAPTNGSVYDGTAGDQDWNDGTLNSLSANWTGFNANASGLLKYEYALRRTDGWYWNTTGPTWQVGEVWYNSGASVATTVTPIYLNTGVNYYFSVKCYDNAGNIESAVSSNGQQISPTLSFSLSGSTVTFADLNNTNGWTDTKTSTVTTSTNAYSGYTAKAYITQLLTSLAYPARTIPNFSYNGASWASPQNWPAGQYGFGYTSNDTLVQGSNRFSGATKYAPFLQTASGDVVADHTDAVTGQTGAVTNEQFTITYKVAVSQTQAASAYQTYAIYIVTANY